MSQAVRIEQDEALEVNVQPARSYAFKSLGKNIDSATATSTGSAFYTADKGIVQWVITASAVTTGGTVLVQGCWKDSSLDVDWYTIATVAFTANGSQYVSVLANERHNFMRTNFSIRTDGTITTRAFADDRFPQ